MQLRCQAHGRTPTKHSGARQRAPSLASFLSRGLATPALPQKCLCRCGHVCLPGCWLYPDSVHRRCKLHSLAAASATVGHAALTSPGLSFQSCQRGATGTLNPLLTGRSPRSLRIVLDLGGPLCDSLPSQTTCSHVPCYSSETSVSQAVIYCEDLEPACQDGVLPFTY